MLSVVERVAALSARIDALGEVEKADYTTDSLAPAHEQLEGLLEGLEKQRARAAAMGKGWASSKAQAALAHLAKVKVKIQRDPGLLIRGNTFANLTDALGQVVKETRIEVGKALTQQQQSWGSVSAEYLQLLANIPGLEALCQEGLALRGELTGAVGTSKDSESAAEITSLLEKGERLLQIQRQVDEFECPEQVRNFLKRAQGPTGAPWSMLVPETRSWLEENNLLAKLRIRLG